MLFVSKPNVFYLNWPAAAAQTERGTHTIHYTLDSFPLILVCVCVCCLATILFKQKYKPSSHFAAQLPTITADAGRRQEANDRRAYD